MTPPNLMTGQDAAQRGESVGVRIMRKYEHLYNGVMWVVIADAIDAAVAEAIAPLQERLDAHAEIVAEHVAAATKERDAEIERLMIIIDGLREGEHEARREEREACARLIEALEPEPPVWAHSNHTRDHERCKRYAAKIRARRPPASAPTLNTPTLPDEVIRNLPRASAPEEEK